MFRRKPHSQIIELVNQERQPLSVKYIAEKLGANWYTVYKAIADIIIKELQERYINVLYDMPIIPLKSTKSLVITPRSMLASSEASELKNQEKRKGLNRE